MLSLTTRSCGIAEALRFRTVTQTPPIQYIKAIRLHQARLMRIRDDLSAAAASARVGYESPSHFNREFKRFSAAVRAGRRAT